MKDIENDKITNRLNTGAIIIEGHVQGLSNTRALGKIGIPVYVLDKNNCIARFSKYCKKFYRCPNYNDDKLADFLIEIAKKNNLKNWVLFPSNDHAVMTIARNKSKLQEFFKFNAPDLAQLYQIYDKDVLQEVASKQKIPVPKKYYHEIIDSSSDFPIIIRGKLGLDFFKTFKKKAFITNSLNEYNETIKFIQKKYNVEDLLIQEFLPFNKNNRAVFCITFIRNGEIKNHFMCQRIREHPFRNGTSTVLKTVIIQEILVYSKLLAQNIKSNGIYEFEYLYNNNQDCFNLIEVNPRTCIQIGFPVLLGNNLPAILYYELLGLEKKYDFVFFNDSYWVHFWTDFFYGVWGILKGEYSFEEILRPYRSKKLIFAVFDLKDIKPFIMETILLPYLKIKRS